MATMENLTHQFLLDIRIPGKTPLKIEVRDEFSAGSDPRNDLVLIGKKVRPKHLRFEKKEEILILHFLGKENEAFLNSIPMEEGKNYMLEKGDVIQVGSTEMIIRHELVHAPVTEILASQPARRVLFHSLDELSKESAHEKLKYFDQTQTSIKRPDKQEDDDKQEREPFLSLVVIKLYAMLTDIFITYMIMVIIFPLLLVDSAIEKLLFSGAELLYSYWPYPQTMNSFIKFFIGWYVLSFMQTLIFGTTFGQYLLGLKNYTKNGTRKLSFGRLFFLRLKTLFFSLFLIPGQSYISNNFLFKAIRKTGLAIILVSAIVSPLFLLTFPFNSDIAVLVPPQKKNTKSVLHTVTVSSFSQALGVSIKTEMSPRFFLLPLLQSDSQGVARSRGFHFFDLKTKRDLKVMEVGSISYEDLERQFEYANPLFSALHKRPLHLMARIKIKELIANTLMLSPLTLTDAFTPFGIFFGSTILVKKELLSLFVSEAQLAQGSVVMFFSKDNPFFILRHAKADLVYFFAEKGISVLSIVTDPDALMEQGFENEILSKFQFVAPDFADNFQSSKSLGILEALDAYLLQDEQTLLTYYINEANKLSRNPIIIEGVDLSEAARAAFIQNISANQKFVKTKTIHTSFEALKTQLTSTDPIP
jgi:hypothetical protein